MAAQLKRENTLAPRPERSRPQKLPALTLRVRPQERPALSAESDFAKRLAHAHPSARRSGLHSVPG